MEGATLELERDSSSDTSTEYYNSLSKAEEHGKQLSVLDSGSVLAAQGGVDLYQSRASTTELCRICHDLDTTELFISPCRCKGSLSYVHKSCLERWLAESDSSRCELCGYNYTLERFPKYGKLFSVATWLRTGASHLERKNLLVDIFVLLIMSPAFLAVTFLLIQKLDTDFLEDAYYLPEYLEDRQVKLPQKDAAPDDPQPLVKYNKNSKYGHVTSYAMLTNFGRMAVVSLVMTVDMAYVSWVMVRLQGHIQRWHRWYRRTCRVNLTGYPLTGVEGASSAGNSASLGSSIGYSSASYPSNLAGPSALTIHSATISPSPAIIQSAVTIHSDAVHS